MTTARPPAPVAPAPGSAAASDTDSEKAPIATVLSQLAVQPDKGLGSREVQQGLGKYGPNAIVEMETSLGEQVLACFTGHASEARTDAEDCQHANSWRQIP